MSAAASVAAGLLPTGHVAARHFASIGMPLVALERVPLNPWDPPDECRHCRAGEPLLARSG